MHKFIIEPRLENIKYSAIDRIESEMLASDPDLFAWNAYVYDNIVKVVTDLSNDNNLEPRDTLTIINSIDQHTLINTLVNRVEASRQNDADCGSGNSIWRNR